MEQKKTQRTEGTEKKIVLIPGWRKTEKREARKNKWRIAVVCKINKICAGEKTSRDTCEESQEPHK